MESWFCDLMDYLDAQQPVSKKREAYYFDSDEVECENLFEFINLPSRHSCENKNILPHDDLLGMKVGHRCEGCKKSWRLHAKLLKESLDVLKYENKEIHGEVRKCFESEVGRNLLANMCDLNIK